MKETNQELESKLNRRDSQLFRMRDSNRSLSNLAQSKQLDQRDKLQKELEEIREQLQLRDEENSVSGPYSV